MATQEVDLSKSRSGAPRRVAAGLLAGALAVFGVALAPPAGARADATSDRLAGATRYGTAAAIAGQDDFAGATTAILASGENFPDALAASGLSGENAPAPIVLTESDSLTDETRVALSELGSLDDIIVVGGTAAVSDEVVTAVEDEGYTVTRVAGNDRYETAAAIAGDVTAGEIDGLTTALIASGEVFADALAGGPVAYAANLPVLLVNSAGIPAATEAALDGIEQVIILGGTARITDETETELEGITGNPAVRVAGVDRFETATLIASTLGEGELGWAPETVMLASGLNFPDALAGGPIGGERQAPIVLSASIPEVTLAYLDGVSDTLRTLIGLGGTAVVSDEDLATALTEGAQNVDNDAATGGDTQTSALVGPELQSAAISGLELDDLAISYTYTFDAELDEDTLNPDQFKLYSYDSNNAATGDTFNTGDEMEIDGDTAIVVFNLADYGVANATLAAVTEGAVEDEEGNPNPPQ
ncbi:MAG TPA: cell wall-binding repeat-containing protein, partial [Acidimicrobiales bacterium]|nr:cell wall-binding repeat-containing protein [Acidimicrobiales bacterium]